MLIDIHTHLDSFTKMEIAEILSRSRSFGVGLVITVGTTMETSMRSVKVSSWFNELFAGVGIHPTELKGPVDSSVVNQLSNLAIASGKVIVMSEIGLDFIEGAPEREIQYQAFREQIRLAVHLDLPIIFHSRGASKEVLRVLREERAYEIGGAMHYFQSDLDTAKEAADLGFFVSLARPLLRLPGLQKVAEELPLEHIVLETDAAPQPFKTKRQNWTEPRHVADIAKKLAQIKKVTCEEVEATTSVNVSKLLEARWGKIQEILTSK